MDLTTEQIRRYGIIGIVVFLIIILGVVILSRRPDTQEIQQPGYTILYTPQLDIYSITLTGDVDNPLEALEKAQEELRRMGIDPDDESKVQYDLEGIYRGVSPEEEKQWQENNSNEKIQEAIDRYQEEQDLLDGKYHNE